MTRRWGRAGMGALATAKIRRCIIPTTLRRADRLAQDQKTIDGIQRFFALNATLTFGSRTMAPADIVAVFQNRIRTGTAVVQAEAARAAAVKADRDERALTTKVVNAFRRFVVATFTESPDTLAAFGLTAPKAGKKTVAVKAQAAAKSDATRKARGTKGSRQKKAIHGTVPPANSGMAPAPGTPTTPVKA
jgi:hypothetical protein